MEFPRGEITWIYRPLVTPNIRLDIGKKNYVKKIPILAR